MKLRAQPCRQDGKLSCSTYRLTMTNEQIDVHLASRRKGGQNLSAQIY